MDPISNMLTIIKNGYLARKQYVSAPNSRLKKEIAKKLAEAGYIGNVTVSENKRIIKIDLVYKDKEPIVNELKRVSKPSLRVYTSSKKIPRILRGRGEVLLSTSKGILTGSQARKMKAGGEILLKIW